MYLSDWPTNYTSAYSYWQNRLNRLRTVLKKRPYLLYNMVKKELKVTDAEMIQYFGPRPEQPTDVEWNKSDKEWF